MDWSLYFGGSDAVDVGCGSAQTSRVSAGSRSIAARRSARKASVPGYSSWASKRLIPGASLSMAVRMDIVGLFGSEPVLPELLDGRRQGPPGLFKCYDRDRRVVDGFDRAFPFHPAMQVADLHGAAGMQMGKHGVQIAEGTGILVVDGKDLIGYVKPGVVDRRTPEGIGLDDEPFFFHPIGSIADPRFSFFGMADQEPCGGQQVIVIDGIMTIDIRSE